MGLLDDAIREHLDLKRARGSDPAEIEKMEREALGPVRREPTIGSVRAQALDEHAPLPREAEFPEDHLTDLEELQEQGYHDSTAPHQHAHHEHHEANHAPADDHYGFEDDRRVSFADETEQPRRRFLRRNRSAAEPVLPDQGFHEDEPEFDPLDHHGPLAHHEPFAHAEPEVDPLADAEPPFDPLAHAEPPHEPPAQHEASADDERFTQDEHLTEQPTTQQPAAPHVPPPHLQFEHPPTRPRFSADPPGLQDEAAAGPQDEVEAQETTEFDVQRHIAETRHHPDETPGDLAVPAPPASSGPPPAAAPPAAAPPADAPPAAEQPPGASAAPAPTPAREPEEDEDVLEETPEFLQDTPEHDRLWFEQRPPKDFDFEG